MKAALFILLAICVASASSLRVTKQSPARPATSDLLRRQQNAVPAVTAQQQTLSLRGGASVGPITTSVSAWINIIMAAGYGCHAFFAPKNFLEKFYSSKAPGTELLGITRWFGLFILQFSAFFLFLKTQYGADEAIVRWQLPSQLLSMALYTVQFNDGLMKSKESFYITPVFTLLFGYIGWF